MPGTLWSAPITALNHNSGVFTSATLGTVLYDISPAQVILFPPQLNEGTRIRLRAHGSYIATTAATSVTLGFYMTAASAATVANPLVATSAVLGAGPSTAVGAVTAMWMAEYEGRITSVSSPLIGLTNAQIVGRGKVYWQTAVAGAFAMLSLPQSVAACTVNQTGTPGFGLVTNIAQLVSVGCTLAVNTGFTSITTDELTCELLG